MCGVNHKRYFCRPPESTPLRTLSRCPAEILTVARAAGVLSRRALDIEKSRGTVWAMTTTTHTPPTFTGVSAVAGQFGVSTQTVRNLVASGELPAIRIGRAIRIRSVDVEVYLDRARSAAVASPHKSRKASVPADADAAAPG